MYNIDKGKSKSKSGYVAERLPLPIRVLLESAIHNCDKFQVKSEDVEKILDWEKTCPRQVEIPFKPARVLLPSGVLKV